jgi:hypothetical protein
LKYIHKISRPGNIGIPSTFDERPEKRCNDRAIDS